MATGEEMTPAALVAELQSVLAAVEAGDAPAGRADIVPLLVGALATLREVRGVIEQWEPALIEAARAAGASWAVLAPALGVASRQAAERRYLRTKSTGGDESTKEARVQATRDRRAGDRAVTAWARQNSAALRQLAGQVGGLSDLTAAGRHDAERVHAELAGNDSSTLLGPLSAMRAHLTGRHPELATRIAEVVADADQQRQDAIESRQASENDR
jgi:hypothetical protein